MSKKLSIELARASLEMVDEGDERPIVQALGELVQIYNKKYEDVKLSLGNEATEDSDGNTNIERIATITGIREETEFEKERRLGLKKDNSSWMVAYQALVGCDKKEAKKNMDDMLSEDMMVSPKEWLEHKKSKINDLFNVK